MKREACRGIGHSFGYNRAEGEDDHLAPADLVRSFVDIVSKNGNLLLDVGPRADATIPEVQRSRLEALGEWLSINGDAVFASRPWIVAEDEASDVEVRYTWRDGDCYAVALEWPGFDEAKPGSLSLSIPRHVEHAPAEAALLTRDGDRACEVTVTDETLDLELPSRPDHEYAYTVRFSGVANPRIGTEAMDE